MDNLTQIFQQAAFGAATAVGSSLVGSVIRLMRDTFVKAGTNEVQQKFERVSQMSEREIRTFMANTFPKSSKVTPQQREELTAILINFSRKLRGIGTVETAESLARKQSQLVEEILSGLQTTRRPGERVGPGREDWALVRFLGRGTFGEVWLGRNIENRDLKYAFKFFTTDDARACFQREQHNLGDVRKRLRNEEQIVQLIDVVVTNQKYPFLVLEYIAGGSLEDWILEDKVRRPLLRKDDIVGSIVKAVSVAHGHGIFHRDLEPANILLTSPPEVQAKVTDFGLADIGAVDPSQPKLATQAGAMPPRPDWSASHAAGYVGTPMYLPPEASLPFAKQDPARADVFAIGVIWYQLLVDRLERLVPPCSAILCDTVCSGDGVFNGPS